MGGLAHFIERAGVATTSISLIREHTEAVRPPRALWVPFALGRPLGVAGDEAFQLRVLRKVLSLLETATAPTIVDYDMDAPEEPDPAAWVCPINLPSVDESELKQRLLAEVARVMVWAQETRRKRGRSLLGASGATHEQAIELASLLAAIAEGAPLDQIPDVDGDVAWAHRMPFLLRHVADDLRILYHEAIAAQPGENLPGHAALTRWIFKETMLGETLLKVAKRITEFDDRRLLTLRGYLIPEGYVAGDESFGSRQPGDPPGFLRALRGNAYLRGETDEVSDQSSG